MRKAVLSVCLALAWSAQAHALEVNGDIATQSVRGQPLLAWTSLRAQPGDDASSVEVRLGSDLARGAEDGDFRVTLTRDKSRPDRFRLAVTSKAPIDADSIDVPVEISWLDAFGRRQALQSDLQIAVLKSLHEPSLAVGKPVAASSWDPIKLDDPDGPSDAQLIAMSSQADQESGDEVGDEVGDSKSSSMVSPKAITKASAKAFGKPYANSFTERSDGSIATVFATSAHAAPSAPPQPVSENKAASPAVAQIEQSEIDRINAQAFAGHAPQSTAESQTASAPELTLQSGAQGVAAVRSVLYAPQATIGRVPDAKPARPVGQSPRAAGHAVTIARARSPNGHSAPGWPWSTMGLAFGVLGLGAGLVFYRRRKQHAGAPGATVSPFAEEQGAGGVGVAVGDRDYSMVPSGLMSSPPLLPDSTGPSDENPASENCVNPLGSSDSVGTELDPPGVKPIAIKAVTPDHVEVAHVEAERMTDLLQESDFYLSQGFIDQALYALSRHLSQNPTDRAAWTKMLEIHATEGRTEDFDRTAASAAVFLRGDGLGAIDDLRSKLMATIARPSHPGELQQAAGARKAFSVDAAYDHTKEQDTQQPLEFETDEPAAGADLATSAPTPDASDSNELDALLLSLKDSPDELNADHWQGSAASTSVQGMALSDDSLSMSIEFNLAQDVAV